MLFSIGMLVTLTLAAVAAELGKVLGRQVVGDVDVALEQQRAAVAGIGHVALDHAAQFRQRAALPVVVAHVDDLLPGAEALHLVGAAAGGVVARPGQAPGVLRRAVLLYQLAVEDAGHHHRQVVHRQLVAAQELDGEGVVVDDHELLGLFQRAGGHLEGGEAAHGDGAVEAPLHVLGGHRRAVVELGVLAQLEGHRLAVGRDLPALGQLGLELVQVVHHAAIRQCLPAIGHQPVVDQPAHAIGWPVGAHGVDVQRIGAELVGHHQHVLGAGLGLGRQGQGQRGQRHRCCRESRVFASGVLSRGGSVASAGLGRLAR
jgi:hypothetical protein